MGTKINWSDRAVTHLNHIYGYIAFDSVVYAKRFVKSLVSAVEKQLQQYYLSGRPVPEFENTELRFLREVIYKGYRIIYNPVSTEKITIVAVMSGRMDLPGSIKADWDIE